MFFFFVVGVFVVVVHLLSAFCLSFTDCLTIITVIIIKRNKKNLVSSTFSVSFIYGISLFLSKRMFVFDFLNFLHSSQKLFSMLPKISIFPAFATFVWFGLIQFFGCIALFSPFFFYFDSFLMLAAAAVVDDAAVGVVAVVVPASSF